MMPALAYCEPRAFAGAALPRASAPQRFAGALLDPAKSVPAGLVAWNGSDPAVRFAVHRNNVRASLVAALADTFRVVGELVGGEFFSAMAALYVADEPPRSPVLAHYGEGFADWVQGFEPAASVPCLADMARLERARVRACHAADEPMLTAHDMAAQLAAHLAAQSAAPLAAHLPAQSADTQRLPHARLELHPSVSVLVSSHAIVSLWAAHQGQGRLEDVLPDEAQAALVLRVEDDAVVLRIPAATATFYRRLQQGLPLGEAAAVDDAAFDLGESLATLIRHGALSAWHDPE